jgi:hypothetical protein
MIMGASYINDSATVGTIQRRKYADFCAARAMDDLALDHLVVFIDVSIGYSLVNIVLTTE